MKDVTNAFDLGSESTENFNPFDFEDDEIATVPEATLEPETPVAPPSPAPKPKPDKATSDDNDSDNPLADAIGAAENQDAEEAKKNLYEKLPVFDYAGATENIEDTSITFEELRIQKAADFPELEEGKRVKFSVSYGKVDKEISDPKGTTIAKIKAEIEGSKPFMDGLKRAKDKNPVCKIKPRVTAQAKGTGYKDVFKNIEEAKAAGKAISIIPGSDGLVHEVRVTPAGTFSTPVVGCNLLSDIRAGFTPAPGIPRIPLDLTMQIIAFFRYFTHQCEDKEVLVNIYWDKQSKGFVVDAPTQTVTKVSVKSEESPEYLNERYIHYMDIHSHNSMAAFFSKTDDADEKATRLYTVMGRFDLYFPEIKTRISNGGKFHEIDPSEVFEHIARPFPPEWKDNIAFRKLHKEDADGDGQLKGAGEKLLPLDEDCCCSMGRCLLLTG